jgi:poly(ADP-ribose) glycohydrolase ARH3
MDRRIERRDKFIGALVGTGVGDAIGELAFRYPSKEKLVTEVDGRQELAYTDDTAMAIGLAQSIVALGGLDQEHLGDTFRESFRREPWRGYASGPPTVFSKVEREGISYVEAARSLYGGEGSFGNGAAMRIAAVGLLFHDVPDLYEKAGLSAAVTHAHPVGIDGAAVQAQAVAQAVVLEPDNALSVHGFLEILEDAAQTSEMERKLLRVGDLIDKSASPQRAAEELGQGVAVHRSQPFALWCFLRHPRSFEETLSCAVLNGGDRDTLGAMACAISGAYLGVDAIPQRWRDKLENYDRIQGLAMRLAEMA